MKQHSNEINCHMSNEKKHLLCYSYLGYKDKYNKLQGSTCLWALSLPTNLGKEYDKTLKILCHWDLLCHPMLNKYGFDIYIGWNTEIKSIIQMPLFTKFSCNCSNAEIYCDYNLSVILTRLYSNLTCSWKKGMKENEASNNCRRQTSTYDG